MTRTTSCILLGTIALLATFSGCGPKPRREVNSEVIEEVQQTRSNLDQAYDMVARIDEFERGPALTNVLSFLTTHLADQQPIKDWQADPLVSRLPRNLRTLPPVEQLHKLEMVGSDTKYLEESILMQKIGAWVVQQKLPDDVEKWLKENEKTLSRETAQDLRDAYLLFDWTVRNIQLDPLLDTAKDIAGASGQGAGGLPAPLRGLAGPGYVGAPWYVAMTGHGDAWQRARVFTQLARQRNIDVVVLALNDPGDAGKLTPWASGVLLGEQIYLFDTAIGLPIPGPNAQGIATLAQVREDDALLRTLDVDKEHPYGVTAEQVKNITMLIDGSLEALSHRMAVLERGLAGDRTLRLTVQPSELAARLRKSPGVSNVALWAVPIEATLFEAALRESPNFDPNLRQMIFEERLMLDQRSLIAEARYKHLRGQFSNTPGEKGAKTLYLEARVPDAEIESLDTDTSLQNRLGLSGELANRKEANARAAFLKQMKDRIRRGKNDCSYWLALAHYETGNFETAVNWFDDRTLKTGGQNWWTPGAHYNLGRTYEQITAPQLAQEQYLAVEGPGTLGALIRAKRLQGQVAK